MIRTGFAVAPVAASMALAFLSSCRGAPSEVLVIVEAQGGVRAQAQSLSIEIYGGERASEEVPSVQVLSRTDQVATYPWPRRFALAPLDGDPDRLYRFVAHAHRAADGGDAPFVTARVISGYQRGETLEVVLLLTDACVDVDCSVEDQTCDPATRMCATAVREVQDLPPHVPDDAGTGEGIDGACVRPSDCDDGVPCTDDICFSGRCGHTFDDLSCADEVTCTEGICLPSGCAQRPVMSRCDDTVSCTRDRCDLVLGCQYELDDGLCDVGPGGRCELDGCQYPLCVEGTTCVPEGPCRPEATCVGDLCQRPSPCAPGEACCAGACGGCDDDNPCTEDACIDDACEHVAKSGGCDDEDPCTMGDSCAGGSCRRGPIGCVDDGNECTRNTCGDTGCVTADVADGMGCTLLGSPCGARCEAGACVSVPCMDAGMPDCIGDGDCDDADSCTLNRCVGGVCSYPPSGSCFDAGDACSGSCTVNETCCSPGVCCDHTLGNRCEGGVCVSDDAGTADAGDCGGCAGCCVFMAGASSDCCETGETCDLDVGCVLPDAGSPPDAGDCGGCAGCCVFMAGASSDCCESGEVCDFELGCVPPDAGASSDGGP